MNPKFLAIAFLFSQVLVSCEKDFKNIPPFNGHGSDGKKQLKIAVVSDIHYMHPSLLVNNGAAGTAFQNYLNQDPKLVQYSDPIFRKVMEDLKDERPDILLVTGDITKDGEKISHQAMAGFFQQMQRTGIKVYVVPGNHDINNAKAKRFDGNNAYPVDMTSKNDFAVIYKDFGYGAAIARDVNSLSYVAQPFPGLRIISIDASKYEEYGPDGDVAAGRIKPATLTWVLQQMAIAKQQHASVFAMMHHNLIEHYAGQSQLDPGYVIDDWQNVANTLADAGLKIIFTGHYHANDIASYSHNGNQLFDIETGSLVTAPIPYRYITADQDRLNISTKNVKMVKADFPGGLGFEAYSNVFLSQHLDGYFNYFLSAKLGAPAQLAAMAAPLFRNGIMAHFAGDEMLPPAEKQKIDGLGPELSGIVTTLWTDTGEKDNTNSISYR